MTTTTDVLLVAPVPPPHGGMATSTAALLAAMAKRPEVHVRVVDISVRWRQPMNDQLLWRVLGGAWHARQIVRAVKAQVRARRPDIIELANCGGAGPALRDSTIMQWLRRNGLPRMLTFHTGRIPHLRQRGGLEARLTWRVCRGASAVVFLDRPSLQILDGMPHMPPAMLRANFVDPARIRSLAGSADLPPDCDVLFVGWMARTKGIFELVEAVRDLPGVRAKLVGPVAPDVAAQLTRLSGAARSRIAIVPPVPNEQIYALIQRAKIVALPSYTEAFPYTILEAMALGKPVVATGIAAIPDMLASQGPEPCGREVGVADAQSLRDALAALLADADLRRTMGERGRMRVDRLFTESVVVPTVISQWRHIAGTDEPAAGGRRQPNPRHP